MEQLLKKSAEQKERAEIRKGAETAYETEKGNTMGTKKQEDPGLLARLSRPTGPVDVVLDTDTYNEIDDQFAVSYLICSAEKAPFTGNLCSAVFSMKKSTGPADGMEKMLSGDLKYSDADGKGRAEKKVYTKARQATCRMKRRR